MPELARVVMECVLVRDCRLSERERDGSGSVTGIGLAGEEVLSVLSVECIKSVEEGANVMKTLKKVQHGMKTV